MSKRLPYRFKNKTCIVCQVEYKPTSARQKACANCFQLFNRRRERILIKNIRGRSRRNGIEFSITKDDILFPEFCPVLGLTLSKDKEVNSFGPNSPSVDRIDPTKGYIPGNVQIISFKANTMKSDASPEELLKFADWIYSNYKNN